MEGVIDGVIGGRSCLWVDGVIEGMIGGRSGLCGRCDSRNDRSLWVDGVIDRLIEASGWTV